MLCALYVWLQRSWRVKEGVVGRWECALCGSEWFVCVVGGGGA